MDLQRDRKAFKCKRILPVKCNTGNFWFYDGTAKEEIAILCARKKAAGIYLQC